MEEERRDFYLYYLYRRYDETGVEEVCYVGRGCKDRFEDHIKALSKGKHYNYLLQSWFDANDSLFFPCVIFTGLTNAEANALEIKHIAEYGRFDLGLGTLANLTDGGGGCAGNIKSAETRAKISKIHKGKVISEAQRLLLRKLRLGTTLSPETKAKIAKAGTGRHHTPKTISKKLAPLKDRNDLICSLKLDGVEVRDIAEIVGVKEHTVREMCRYRGIKGPERCYGEDKVARDAKIVEMALLGVSDEAITEALGLAATVSKNVITQLEPNLRSNIADAREASRQQETRVRNRSIYEQYKSGISVSTLCNQYGVNAGTVYQAIRQNDATDHRLASVQRNEKIMKLRAQGLSYGSIGKKLGIKETVVSGVINWAKRKQAA